MLINLLHRTMLQLLTEREIQGNIQFEDGSIGPTAIHIPRTEYPPVMPDLKAMQYFMIQIWWASIEKKCEGEGKKEKKKEREKEKKNRSRW